MKSSISVLLRLGQIVTFLDEFENVPIPRLFFLDFETFLPKCLKIRQKLVFCPSKYKYFKMFTLAPFSIILLKVLKNLFDFIVEKIIRLLIVMLKRGKGTNMI